MQILATVPEDKLPETEEELELQNALDQKARIVSIDPVTEAFLTTKDGGYMVTNENGIDFQRKI